MSKYEAKDWREGEVHYLTEEEHTAWVLELCRTIRMGYAEDLPSSVAQHAALLHDAPEAYLGNDSLDAFRYAMTPTGRVRRPEDDYKAEHEKMLGHLAHTSRMATSAPVRDKTRTSKAVGEYKKPVAVEGRKVQCAKSQWHGFHLSTEACPECDPPKLYADIKGTPSVYALPQQDLYVMVHDGTLWNSVLWPFVRNDQNYVRLGAVYPGTVEARRVCGCITSRGGAHRWFRNKFTYMTLPACDMPMVFQDPTYEELP